jgi:hypothetical protein
LDEIERLYRQRVAEVMGAILSRKKTAKEVFGDPRFDAFKTDMGIEGTRRDDDPSIIFKKNRVKHSPVRAPSSRASAAQSLTPSWVHARLFSPGKIVTIGRGGEIEVRDGRFVANNPTLYAIADATESRGHSRENVRVGSISVECLNW